MNAILKRSAALLMSISVASGVFAGCGEKADVSKETSGTAAVSETSATAETEESQETAETSTAETEAKMVNGFKSLDVTTPQDEEGAERPYIQLQ